jgi:UDP-N-acetylglucosamine 2-epimerase (non-hydrolysing)
VRKILVVFGTRPEAIKMAPVVLRLRRTPDLAHRVCVTGQHRQMLDDVLKIFAIEPDHDLKVMRPNQSLAAIASGVLEGLDPILESYAPDFVLVQGDTSTSTIAALAAFYRRVKIGHVEAGLRTGNLQSPWPEEANRRLTGVIADRHYAPTTRARDSLLQEGVAPETVLVTGNTVIDALRIVAEAVTQPGPDKLALDQEFSWIDPAKRMILVTGHRRESFGEGFAKICRALREIAERGDVTIVYPVHLNPNVRSSVSRYLADIPDIKLIEPVDYRRFIYLMTRAYLILTDSGGVQEEGPSLRKPVLVMRDTSERMEAVDAGVARLVTTETASIVRNVEDLLDRPDAYCSMIAADNPFGDGRAAERIVEDLLK